MQKIKSYDIPEEIRKIESGTDSLKLKYYKNLVSESRNKATAYKELLSAMIYLEEAANSVRVQKFDLKNVQLLLHSRKDNIFTTNYDDSMPNFSKAIKDSTIKELTIKSIRSEDVISSAKIIRCDESFIYFKVEEGTNKIFNSYVDKGQMFNINFFINRSTYQLQHEALNWMESHELFDILIKNSLYDHAEDIVASGSSILSHQFR